MSYTADDSQSGQWQPARRQNSHNFTTNSSETIPECYSELRGAIFPLPGVYLEHVEFYLSSLPVDWSSPEV